MQRMFALIVKGNFNVFKSFCVNAKYLYFLEQHEIDLLIAGKNKTATSNIKKKLSPNGKFLHKIFK